MTPAEILTRAADEIERRGKATGAYRDGNGRVCAIGAMRLAVGLLPDCDMNKEPPGFRVTPHLVRVFVNDLVSDWNDHNDAPTVISTLRAIAVCLQAQERAAVAVLVPA